MSPAKPIGPPQPGARCLRMAKHPSLKVVLFDDLARNYGAIDFQDALADLIAHTNHPATSGVTLSALAADTLIPFHSVPVYHKIKFSNSDGSEIVDTIQIWPEQKDPCGHPIPLRFDTVLVWGKAQDGSLHGINGKSFSHARVCPPGCCIGHRIAQVRVVFEIPSRVNCDVFPSSDITPPEHLAYVEWFLPIPVTPGLNHLLYKVNRLMHHGQQCASIIPVKFILCSVHLFPVFGQHTQEWNTFTALELCNAFYINPFSNQDNYMTFGSSLQYIIAAQRCHGIISPSGEILVHYLVMFGYP